MNNSNTLGDKTKSSEGSSSTGNPQPTLTQPKAPSQSGTPATVQEAVDRKVKGLALTRQRQKQCVQELDVLMDQLRDLLLEEHPAQKEGKRGAGEVEDFWNDVRARLGIKDEEIWEES